MKYTATEQRIVDDVKKFGWHVGLLKEEDGEPAFGYTIGLWSTYKHPELIAFGLDLPTLHSVLNDAADKVKHGETLQTGVNDDDIFEGLPAQYVAVDPELMKNYFGFGMWFHKYEPFPALQLVWPDSEGKFPWEPEFDEGLKARQPMLNNEHEGR